MSDSTSTALQAAKKGGLAVFAQGTANPFVGAAQREGVSDGVFVRFNGNTGDWVITGDAEPLENGSFLAFLLYHAKVAWLGFDPDNKPKRGPEVLIASGEALQDPPEDDPDIRWNKIVMVAVRGMGPDSKQMILSAKADKPTRPIWKLIKKYGETMGRNLDAQGQHKIPVIEIGNRSFEITVEEEKDGKKRKVKATKYADSYEIRDWASEAELAELVKLQESAAEGEEGADAGVVDAAATATADAPASTNPAPAPAASRPAAQAATAAAKPATAPGGQDWRNRGRVGQRQ